MSRTAAAVLTFFRQAVGVAVLAALSLASVPAQARDTSASAVSFAELPAEVRQTHQRIVQGGPFPHAKDGSVFGNRERRLPAHPGGYYREYTVPTPGAADRGARRIVCGGQRPAVPDSCFYTADHYASFRRISR